MGGEFSDLKQEGFVQGLDDPRLPLGGRSKSSPSLFLPSQLPASPTVGTLGSESPLSPKDRRPSSTGRTSLVPSSGRVLPSGRTLPALTIGGSAPTSPGSRSPASPASPLSPMRPWSSRDDRTGTLALPGMESPPTPTGNSQLALAGSKGGMSAESPFALQMRSSASEGALGTPAGFHPAGMPAGMPLRNLLAGEPELRLRSEIKVKRNLYRWTCRDCDGPLQECWLAYDGKDLCVQCLKARNPDAGTAQAFKRPIRMKGSTRNPMRAGSKDKSGRAYTKKLAPAPAPTEIWTPGS